MYQIPITACNHSQAVHIRDNDSTQIAKLFILSRKVQTTLFGFQVLANTDLHNYCQSDVSGFINLQAKAGMKEDEIKNQVFSHFSSTICD